MRIIRAVHSVNLAHDLVTHVFSITGQVTCEFQYQRNTDSGIKSHICEQGYGPDWSLEFLGVLRAPAVASLSTVGADDQLARAKAITCALLSAPDHVTTPRPCAYHHAVLPQHLHTFAGIVSEFTHLTMQYHFFETNMKFVDYLCERRYLPDINCHGNCAIAMIITFYDQQHMYGSCHYSR